jgi:hypothetical protein
MTSLRCFSWLFLCLALAPEASGFALPAQQAKAATFPALFAYVETSAESVTPLPPSKSPFASSTAKPKEIDMISLGTLKVPAVGVGTIAWSADKGESIVPFLCGNWLHIY